MPRCAIAHHSSRYARRNDDPQKEKGPTFVGPVLGIYSPANRPDPDGPGGLGAEESGTERTGPTQGFLVARQRGGRWAEVGQQYDSANDPVTRCLRISGGRTIGRAWAVFIKGLLQRPAVGAIMYVSA